VESLIGPETASNPIQHVRIKPPQRAVPKKERRAHVIATDWRQDKGVTLEEADDTEFVTVWLAITDATIENGCLQVASGNYDTMLPHCAKTQDIPRHRWVSNSPYLSC
jgi:ectoine hydroxylase-related dioxygenase (phytanoyl-CoA dioxygenase family)